MSPRHGAASALARPEGGSTLLLFPAALLIMVALAAMTVDSTIAFLGQRELANATTAAANDAAAESVSDSAFYQGNVIELSESTVEAVAIDRVGRLIDRTRHHDLAVDAHAQRPAGPGCAWTVMVSASSRIDQLFGRAIPGPSHQTLVRATAVASPRQSSGSC